MRDHGCDRWLEHIDGTERRCKLEQSNGRVKGKCTRYNVYLCLTKDRICFRYFQVKL